MINLKIKNENQILKVLKQKTEKVIEEAAEKLFQMGQSTIKDARDNAKFMNHTNNLRSSLGVAVSLNGKILKSDFELVGDGKKGDGSDGYAKAEKLINERVEEYKDKLLLILVAGEDYAMYVENRANKSVLTTFARQLIKKLK
ncbi:MULTISPECIES: hypothetical protein [Sphingobacterium]|uniref:HK97 gp10 family phage protein n=1 Tax=Sphingobacterium tenebrionis TaxID=3111775 RepID=A0ABU8I4L0_9SPHI|nr:hypothetical protein [Sphingobacterium sp. CZ-2]QBR11478.1 hypothetical protein E3D81_04530 [Sphingobacterium sp. CZ-2]